MGDENGYEVLGRRGGEAPVTGTIFTGIPVAGHCFARSGNLLWDVRSSQGGLKPQDVIVRAELRGDTGEFGEWPRTGLLWRILAFDWGGF